MLFQPGQSGNPEGNKNCEKNGAGRKPNWLKDNCKKIIEEYKLIEFLGKVARGDEVEQEKIYVEKINKEIIINRQATIKDRLKATEILLDRGFGRPIMPIGDGEDGLSKTLDFLRERYKD